jgi:hypothetical protein
MGRLRNWSLDRGRHVGLAGFNRRIRDGSCGLAAQNCSDSADGQAESEDRQVPNEVG